MVRSSLVMRAFGSYGLPTKRGMLTRSRLVGNERNSALCIAAYVYCEAKLTSAYAATGLSMYDMTKKGDYQEGKWIEAWLNKCVSRSSSAIFPDRLSDIFSFRQA